MFDGALYEYNGEWVNIKRLRELKGIKPEVREEIKEEVEEVKEIKEDEMEGGLIPAYNEDGTLEPITQEQYDNSELISSTPMTEALEEINKDIKESGIIKEDNAKSTRSKTKKGS